jgi:hypothetical protein
MLPSGLSNQEKIDEGQSAAQATEQLLLSVFV